MKQSLLSVLIVLIVIVQFAYAGSTLQEIKKNANAKWPEDYVMQLYEIKNQSDAYVAIN